jgi:hypothetical protein
LRLRPFRLPNQRESSAPGTSTGQPPKLRDDEHGRLVHRDVGGLNFLRIAELDLVVGVDE